MTTRWTPHRLPRMRRDMAAATRSAAVDLAGEMSEADRVELERLTDRVLVADLYWVTADMAELATRAASTLPEWTPAEAMPSGHGVLVWERPIAAGPWVGAPERGFTRSPFGTRVPPQVQVWGVSWWPDPDDPDRPGLGLLARSAELGDLLAPRWARPDLYMFAGVQVPRADILRGGDYDGDGAAVVRTLAATWLLLQQPTVVSRASLDGPSTGTGAAARAARPAREVTIVDLRRLPDPERGDADAGTSGRVYTRRWIVSGYWRQQRVGPGRAHRKPTWVRPHEKGPDGAPLIDPDRVNVLRR